MQAKNQKNTTSMGSFDDAFITETEYHQRVLMLNQIEGLLLFVDEIKFDGMELLEQEEDELGSIDFEDDDCFTVDSLELNIKRIAPSKYRARNKKITRRLHDWKLSEWRGGPRLERRMIKPSRTTELPN
jgi:hypothetical protein